ncbi:MAG TPA: Gfo/Idh/MocA family oxidoreductase [Gemmatimonadaceae bacterium]|nr:Gfo/Idh/MocA family oxidoreductase [Gemmatimonadaceae bacterium]
MKKKTVSRREFIGVSAAAAGATLAGKPLLGEENVPQKAVRLSPNDPAPLRFGIIGVGMQGTELLGTAIKLPGVSCVAAADVYDGRHLKAREITSNPALRTTRRYQDLLSDKSIDAIIAAVPDHWHKQIVLDTVAAGKDIYIEKPMSHSPAEGVEMVDAVRKSGRILQVGSQRVSSPDSAKAREMIASGMLGDLMMVEGSMGRNDPCGAWVYPPPPGLSPANLDWDTWIGSAPKHAFDPNLYARWRQWKEYGTGVAGDLLVHLVTGLMFMMDWKEPPSYAAAVGGIRHFKDGRNMPDIIATNFYWHDTPVYMRLNLGNEEGDGYRFLGSKGTLEVRGDNVTFTPQVGFDTYPCYYTNSYDRAMKQAYDEQWHRENDAKVAAAATQTVIHYHAPEYDGTYLHLKNFFDAVRSRQPVVEDVVFGHYAALACHMANESWLRRTAVTWDNGSNTIKSA